MVNRQIATSSSGEETVPEAENYAKVQASDVEGLKKKGLPAERGSLAAEAGGAEGALFGYR
jgi:hypothetical protein